MNDYICEYGCPECPKLRADVERLTRENDTLRSLVHHMDRITIAELMTAARRGGKQLEDTTSCSGEARGEKGGGA